MNWVNITILSLHGLLCMISIIYYNLLLLLYSFLQSKLNEDSLGNVIKSSLVRYLLQYGHWLLLVNMPWAHSLHSTCKQQVTMASSILSKQTGHIIASFSLIYLINSVLYLVVSSFEYVLMGISYSPMSNSYWSITVDDLNIMN